MALLNTSNRLKASSLIEVIVSMTIVLLTMGLTIQLVTQIFSATQSHKKLMSYLLLSNKHTEAVKTKMAVKQSGSSISVTIDKDQNVSLMKVTTSLSDSGSIDTLQLKQLILAEK